MIADASKKVWSHHTADLTTSSDLPSKQALKERVSIRSELAHVSRKDKGNRAWHKRSASFYAVVQCKELLSCSIEIWWGAHHRSGTPDALVLCIIEPKLFSTSATEWWKRQESIALEQYERHQQSLGYLEITVCKAGFVICEEQPFNTWCIRSRSIC